MGFLGLGSRKSGSSTTTAIAALASATTTTCTTRTTMESSPPPSLSVVEERLRNALWSFFAGDALAAPTHWFYGGEAQVRQYYGPDGITGYTRPSFQLTGSLLNKSDPSGGGRFKTSGTKDATPQSIIGDVINHGKLELWDPQKQIHYHATLQAGEITLEAQLARVVMQSMVATGGIFDPNHFRQSYVKFMTTPGSHNDAYASTCHRMFFANWVYRKLPLEQCPDNDGHNVDTVDGLVLPTVVALGATARAAALASHLAAAESETTCPQVPWRDDVSRQAVACASVTRKSPVLENAAAAWGQFVGSVLWHGNTDLVHAAEQLAVSLQLRRKPRVIPHTELTACYLEAAFPALLDDVVTANAQQLPVWQALLRNANAGGENVHRGSCLGAVLGASVPVKGERATASPAAALDPALVAGLHDRATLEREIDAFVASVLHLDPPSSSPAEAVQK